jgi:Uma2 family endonuclease
LPLAKFPANLDKRNSFSGYILQEGVPPVTQVLPDLVVEIHSPSDLDSKPGRDAAQAKIAQYLAKGVQIVWAINPREQTVEIYYPGQNTPAKKLGIEAELNGEQ